MKKILACLLMLCLTGCGFLYKPVKSSTDSKALAAVKKEAKDKKEMAYVGEDKQILLVAKYGTYEAEKGIQGAIEADAFLVNGDKKTYLGKMETEGTAYPILYKDGSIIVGTHHSSTRYTLTGNMLKGEEVGNFDLNSKKNKSYHSTFNYVNDKKEHVKKDIITNEEASKLDYYGNAYNKKTIVDFKKA